MILSFGQVLALPLDVYSVRGGDMNIDMSLVWKIIYISTGIYLFVIHPIASTYCNTDEDDSTVK